MIIFISGLIMSMIIYKLGIYATLISMIALASKVAVGLALAVALILIIRRYKGYLRRGKLRFLK